jgi:hypothetical protein
MFNCMMKWLKYVPSSYGVVYHCISAQVSFNCILRAYAQSIYIETSLRAYPYALEVAVMIRHNYLIVHTRKSLVHQSGVIGPRSRRQTKAIASSRQVVQPIHDTSTRRPPCGFVEERCNEPLDMDLTWRQVRDTYGYFTRSRQPHPDAFRLPSLPSLKFEKIPGRTRGLGPTRL